VVPSLGAVTAKKPGEVIRLGKPKRSLVRLASVETPAIEIYAEAVDGATTVTKFCW